MSYRKLLSLTLTLTAIFQALPVLASELTLTPKLRIAEEYNDNIFTTRQNKETDYITHVNPSIFLDYKASRLIWYLKYSPEYLKFAHNSGVDRVDQFLNTETKLTLLENRLFLKVGDSYNRVATSVAQDIANSGGYVNQMSRNVFSVSPYVEFHPDTQTLLTTGYLYNNYHYSNKEAIDKYENGGFLSVSREVSRRTYLVADARYSYVTPEKHNDYSRSTLSLGIKREYAANSFANLEGGYTLFDFKNGGSTSSPFWSAGLQHDFGATTASVMTGVAYNSDAFRVSSEDRYVLARLENRTGRGLAAIYGAYDDYLDNTTNDTYLRRTRGGGSYEYNFTDQFSGTVGITADKYSKGSTYSFLPYYTSESVGIKYAFPYDLTASLTYTHYSWEKQLWHGKDSIETNRVMLDLVMTLPGLHKTF